MERLGQVKERIASITELQGIVGAMRSLAAVHLRQAQQSLPGIREYSSVIAAAVADALILSAAPPRARPPAEPARPMLIVFSAEHGFGGAFADRLLDRASELVAQRNARLYIAGTRGARLAAERGLDVDDTTPMASHLGGVQAAARRVTAALYRFVSTGAVSRASMLYAACRTGAQFVLHEQALFPLDPAALPAGAERVTPTHYLPAPALVEKLTTEYLLAQLLEAATESFASENAARLRTMTAAHDNVKKKLEDLIAQERRLRQEAITTELIDVVTGAEALKSESI
ncbi:MAG TPA: F0F1 ATP synthase subunit gamma [Vicinamibacterales bacterium]|nr:F0F1 ATP synthase subunit gamma [Vicinamibacterales bacterium]